MRALLLVLACWSLAACSAVTVSVRGQAAVPVLYGRPSLGQTETGAQVVARTEDLVSGRPVRTLGLAIRNATDDKLMEVDWREASLVDPEGGVHGLRPGLSQLSSAGDMQGPVTIPPHQTARLDVATADEGVRPLPPARSPPGTIVTAATLRVPVAISGHKTVAELPITFFTDAERPVESRPRVDFTYGTRIAFEPGLAGLMGTMCFLTASYFGGLCWLYLIFPTSGQKDRALAEATESLRQQYGPGTTVLTSEVTHSGW